MNFCVKITRDDTGQEIMQQQLNKKLAKLPEEYFHSGTSFYILNQAYKFVRLKHWKDVANCSVSSAEMRRFFAAHY